MTVKTPFVIVNFKTYKESSGANAVKLAKICEEVSKKTKVDIAVAVQPADLYHVSRSVNIKVFAQHIDPFEAGKFTGHILIDNIKENGASGTLLNHSERKLDAKTLQKSVEAAEKAGLIVVVCAATPDIAKHAASLIPNFIAIEPPELIGGDISVSTAKPEIITNTLKKVESVSVLCGAGLKTTEDVRIAYKLGVKGILVASGVVLAKDPKKELLNLMAGFS